MQKSGIYVHVENCEKHRERGLQPPLLFPAHDERRERVEENGDGDPREEDAEVEADARVFAEEDGAEGFDDWFHVVRQFGLYMLYRRERHTSMKRPGVSPSEESRR